MRSWARLLSELAERKPKDHQATFEAYKNITQKLLGGGAA